MPDWCVYGNQCWRTRFLLFSYKCDNAILLSDTDSQSADASGASDNDATLLSDIGSDDSTSSDNGVTLLSNTDSRSNDDYVTSDNGATLLSETDSQNNEDSVANDNGATWFSDSEDDITYSEKEIQALCIVSYIIRHNVSSTATKDLLQLCLFCAQIHKTFKI